MKCDICVLNGSICDVCFERARSEAISENFDREQRVQQKKARERVFGVYTCIAAEMKKIAADAKIEAYMAKRTVNGETFEVPQLTFDEFDCSYVIEMREERSRDSWRSRPTGKTRINVGTFGDRTSFPQRKDGSWNFPAIAEAVVRCMKARKARAERESVQSLNSKKAEALCDKFGLYSYAVMGTSWADRPFSLKLDASLTEETAAKLIPLLIEAGMLSKRPG